MPPGYMPARDVRVEAGRDGLARDGAGRRSTAAKGGRSPSSSSWRKRSRCTAERQRRALALHHRADDQAAGKREPEAALPPAAGARRDHALPRLHRAEVGIRLRVDPHDGRARRRRLRDQRPQGLDERRRDRASTAGWRRGRTPTGRSTAGISVFMVPMDQPGVEVRPIDEPLDKHWFNEVVFDDARVPIDGAGWW